MIIDVHGHVTSPALLAKYPMPPSLGDIEGMLDQKAELGIELTIIGTPVGSGTMMRIPGHDNFAATPDDLRVHHEWMAETVAKHPGRLLAYAYTNPFGGDAMLAEAARLVRQDGFVGLIVNSSVKGRFLDVPEADDFWAMAAELGAPVFLHPPAEPVGAEALDDMRLVEQVARFCDVSTAIAAIIFAGRLEQHPGVRLIAATAGGALALVARRLDVAYAPRHWGPQGGGPPGGGPPGGGPPGGGPPGGGPPGGGPPPWARVENRITRDPTTFFDQVYVDTANPNPYHHAANLAAFGAERMLFGTDSPPLSSPLSEAIALVEDLPIDAAAKQRIFEGNARELFGIAG